MLRISAGMSAATVRSIPNSSPEAIYAPSLSRSSPEYSERPTVNAKTISSGMMTMITPNTPKRVTSAMPPTLFPYLPPLKP